MKAYICDNPACGRQVEPTPHDLSPNGWYNVTACDGTYKRKDFCSTPCLLEWTTMRAEDERLKATPPPPPPEPLAIEPLEEAARG